MVRLLIAALAAALPANAARAQGDVRILEVRYLDAAEVARVLSGIFDVNQYSFDPTSRTLVFRAPGEVATEVAGVIERIDVEVAPPPAIELTAHVLMATRTAVPGADMTPELDAVVAGLDGVLPYGGYNLLDTLIIRVVDGEWFTASGILPALPGEPGFAPDYTLNATIHLDRPNPEARTLGLDDLEFVAAVPVSSQVRNVRFSTSADIGEGETVVVGKASVADAALVLVMRANIIDRIDDRIDQ